MAWFDLTRAVRNCSRAAFAVPVTYTGKGKEPVSTTPSGAALKGIFRRAGSDTTGVIAVESTGPTLDVEVANFAAPIQRGDVFLISKAPGVPTPRNFRVIKNDEDGEGGAKLTLQAL